MKWCQKSNKKVDGKDSSLKRLTQDFGIERHGFQLPPPFYPTRSAAIIGPPARSPSPESDIRFARNYSSYSRSNLGDVVFGSYYESGQSSPVIPPSASSPPFSPETVDSNTSPSPTHSSYQVCSHSPSAPGLSPFSKIAPRPQEYTELQPSYLPFRYGYDIPPTYYSNMQPYIPPGSYAPLTPSTTPSNKQSKAWPMPENPIKTRKSSDAPSVFFEDVQPDKTEVRPVQVGYDQEGDQEDDLDSTYDSGTQCFNPIFDQATVVPVNSVDWPRDDSRDKEHQYEQGHTADLSKYLSHYFNREEYADCSLIVSDKKKQFQYTTFVLHSVLIAQSTTLKFMLEVAECDSQGRKELRLCLNDRFITLSAIEATLRACYGQFPTIFQRHISYDASSTGQEHLAALDKESQCSDTSLAFAMALVAAGCTLGMPAVASFALKSAIDSLTFYNIDDAFFFGYSSLSLPKEDINQVGEMGGDKLGIGGETDASYLEEFRRAILDFVIMKLPNFFELDTTAPAVLHPGSSPSRKFVDRERSTSHRRLSSIQFGDFPIGNKPKHDAETSKMSSVLLSIPTLSLDYVFNNLDQSTKQRFMGPVQKERQRRAFLASSEKDLGLRLDT